MIEKAQTSLFKYTKINEKTLENLSKNQIYFAPATILNDPYEYFFSLEIAENCYDDFLRLIYGGSENQFNDAGMSKEEALEYTRRYYFGRFRETLGVHCLTSSQNNDIMWTHYGDCHKGICIEYEQQCFPFSSFEAVKYVDEIYNIKVMDVDDFEKNVEIYFSDVFTRKNKIWGYENEYRLLYPVGVVRYSKEAIKSITFGFHSKQECREKIIEATSHLNIQYYEVIRSIENYKISRQKISSF